MECPYCEGEISETAKKCKHCGEWLEKVNDKTNESINQHYTKKEAKKGNFLSDYGLWIVIGGIILWNVFNSNKAIENDYVNERTENQIITNISYEFIGDEDISEQINASDNGFILFEGTNQECKIEGEKNINSFVNNLKKANNGESIEKIPCSQTFKDIQHKKTAILLDNSYSIDLNGQIETSGPKKRMELLSDYITDKNFPNGSEIDFSFMFSITPKDNSYEPDMNLYKFKIDSSNISYKKHGNGTVNYDDKRNTLIIRKITLESTFDGQENCIKSASDTYTCYNADGIIKKLHEIYKQEYDKEETHTDHLLLKTLDIHKDWFSNNSVDELYIFTDGEFKIGYEWETMYLYNLKQKFKNQRGHDQGVDKTHNMTEFTVRYANWYQKDHKYENFWKESISILKDYIPSCKDTKIHMVGLSRSSAFTNLAESVYSHIFSPCEISFN